MDEAVFLWYFSITVRQKALGTCREMILAALVGNIRRSTSIFGDEAPPTFALYGEDVWPEGLDALHVESLAERSRRHDWTIRPHRHADLHQLMWIETGGGRARIGGFEEEVTPHTLLAIPPKVSHGFAWEPGSTGYVLMVRRQILARFTPEEDEPMLAEAMTLRPNSVLRPEFAGAFAGLLDNFRRPESGRSAALFAGILTVVAAMARSRHESRGRSALSNPRATLVARFRQAVEDDYANAFRLDAYCHRMGVTAGQLTRACAAGAGCSPQQIIHQRKVLEAKRMLTYSALPISQIAFALGFGDPAYFSRFFQRHAGLSPLAFRQSRGA
jgi:AraC family transcriptional activator of pobA